MQMFQASIALQASDVKISKTDLCADLKTKAAFTVGVGKMIRSTDISLV